MIQIKAQSVRFGYTSKFHAQTETARRYIRPKYPKGGYAHV